LLPADGDSGAVWCAWATVTCGLEEPLFWSSIECHIDKLSCSVQVTACIDRHGHGGFGIQSFGDRKGTHIESRWCSKVAAIASYINGALACVGNAIGVSVGNRTVEDLLQVRNLIHVAVHLALIGDAVGIRINAGACGNIA